MNAATIDATGSNEWRGQQQTLAGTLAQTAAGRGPSVAVEQYKKGLGDIARQSMGMANAARGNDRVFAKMQAQAQGAEALGQANEGAARIRAQEAATAQGQLGGLITGARGQDVGLATTAAGFQQQANQTGAQLGTQVSLANAAQQGNTSQFNAGLGADLSKFNAGATNTRNLATAGMQNEMQRFNAGEAGGTSRFNAGQDLAGQQFNAGTAADLGKFNAGLTQQNQISNADRALAGGQFNIGAQNDLSKFNTGQANATSQFNAGQSNQIGQFNAGQANQVGLANNAQAIQVAAANMDAQLKARGMDDAQRAQYINAWLQSQGLAIQGDSAIAGVQAGDAAGRRQMWGQAFNAAGQVATTAAGMPPIGAANFGANNAPSIYGGNTVQF